MLTEHTAFFMVILSHGEQNDFIYGKNGNSVQVDDLIEPFRGNNCPGLAGKPKIFIVNACRGTTYDDGFEARLYPTRNELDRKKSKSTSENDNNNDKNRRAKSTDRADAIIPKNTKKERRDYEQIKIPHCADVLIAFSCVSGYYSWRNKIEGSWFVQALCNQLREADYEKDDFMRLLTKASNYVAYRMESNAAHRSMDEKKQVPCIVSSLTKCLFFE